MLKPFWRDMFFMLSILISNAVASLDDGSMFIQAAGKPSPKLFKSYFLGDKKNASDVMVVVDGKNPKAVACCKRFEGKFMKGSTSCTAKRLHMLLLENPSLQDATDWDEACDDSLMNVNANTWKSYPGRKHPSGAVPNPTDYTPSSVYSHLDWLEAPGQQDGTYDPTSDLGRDGEAFILDTGVNCDHSQFRMPRLRGIGRRCVKIFQTYPVVQDCNRTDSNCARDADGHGTMVASVVGGRNFGGAPYTRLNAIKVLDDTGMGEDFNIITGMDKAVEVALGYGRRAVMVLSVGGPVSGLMYQFAINRALRRGMVTVVAAGNEGKDACEYEPAWVPNAITVGAGQEVPDDMMELIRAPYSNYGRCVNMFAVGTWVHGATHKNNRGITALTGTSMAAPGGAAAYISSAVRMPFWMSARRIKNVLLQYTMDNRILDTRGGSTQLASVEFLNQLKGKKGDTSSGNSAQAVFQNRASEMEREEEDEDP